MPIFSHSTSQALALLAVDNIRLNKTGLELLSAVDRGEMTINEAKEAVKARARGYGAKTITQATQQIKTNNP